MQVLFRQAYSKSHPSGVLRGIHRITPVEPAGSMSWTLWGEAELHYSCSPLLFKWVLLAFPALSLEESIDVCPLSGILVLLSGIKQL